MTRHSEHEWHLETMDASVVKAPQNLTSAQLQHQSLQRLRAQQAASQARRQRQRLITLCGVLALVASLAAIAGAL